MQPVRREYAIKANPAKNMITANTIKIGKFPGMFNVEKARNKQRIPEKNARAAEYRTDPPIDIFLDGKDGCPTDSIFS
jgi:hypothetical protein